MAITLTVEDGSATVASANSYIELTFADSFCENLGLTAWASAATDTRSSAILRGMAYLDSLNFRGAKEDYDNPLEWPRSGVVDDDGYAIDYDEIPAKLMKATAQAAYEEILSPGALQSTISGGVKREKIDVLEIEYFASSSGSEKVFTALNGYLRGLLDTGEVSGSMVEVFRV
jgi:hypothetical protein